KKALKAMARPVKEIADAITRQDARWLSTLPGIGATTAEQIITTLKRKVAGFVVPSPGASSSGSEVPESKPATKASSKKETTEKANLADPQTTEINSQVIDDVYQTLMALGLTPLESRNKLDSLLQSGARFKTVQDAISVIYSHGK